MSTFETVPGKFVGIVSQDRSDSKSNRLCVDINFRFCFHSIEIYSSIDSSKTISNSIELSNFNRLFLKLNQFICNYITVSSPRTLIPNLKCSSILLHIRCHLGSMNQVCACIDIVAIFKWGLHGNLTLM